MVPMFFINYRKKRDVGRKQVLMLSYLKKSSDQIYSKVKTVFFMGFFFLMGVVFHFHFGDSLSLNSEESLGYQIMCYSGHALVLKDSSKSKPEYSKSSVLTYHSLKLSKEVSVNGNCIVWETLEEG